jgi:hypothetical protein
MGDPLNPTKPFTCVTCEIEIAGPATFHAGLPFCCAGCVAGGPCTCSYDVPPNAHRIRHCLDIEGLVSNRAEPEGQELTAGNRR